MNFQYLNLLNYQIYNKILKIPFYGFIYLLGKNVIKMHKSEEKRGGHG